MSRRSSKSHSGKIQRTKSKEDELMHELTKLGDEFDKKQRYRKVKDAYNNEKMVREIFRQLLEVDKILESGRENGHLTSEQDTRLKKIMNWLDDMKKSETYKDDFSTAMGRYNTHMENKKKQSSNAGIARTLKKRRKSKRKTGKKSRRHHTHRRKSKNRKHLRRKTRKHRKHRKH